MIDTSVNVDPYVRAVIRLDRASKLVKKALDDLNRAEEAWGFYAGRVAQVHAGLDALIKELEDRCDGYFNSER